MTTKKKEWRGAVITKGDWAEGFTFPRDGWAVPRKMEVHAELPGGVRLLVEIEVAEGKACARRVTVETDNPHGVGWAALAKAPVRDIVATAVLDTLMKATSPDEGAVQLVPPERKDAKTVEGIVQAAVGYRPRTEGFERGA